MAKFYSCPVCGKGAYTHPQTTMCSDCEGYEEKVLDIAVRLFPSVNPDMSFATSERAETCFRVAEQFMAVHERRVGHVFKPVEGKS